MRTIVDMDRFIVSSTPPFVEPRMEPVWPTPLAQLSPVARQSIVEACGERSRVGLGARMQKSARKTVEPTSKGEAATPPMAVIKIAAVASQIVSTMVQPQNMVVTGSGR